MTRGTTRKASVSHDHPHQNDYTLIIADSLIKAKTKANSKLLQKNTDG